MAKTKKKRADSKPTMAIKRFKTEEQAEEYAYETSIKMKKYDFEVTRPKGKLGVTMLTGVKNPAVLVVTPRGKIPRLSPKPPRISPKMPKLR